MTKILSVTAAALLALATTAPAWADCGVKHTADISKPEQPMTPKPKTGS